MRFLKDIDYKSTKEVLARLVKAWEAKQTRVPLFNLIDIREVKEVINPDTAKVGDWISLE